MSIFALIDCNNFFASCERSFNPALEKQPVVILSNNDGCVIARSNEAKKLGIPMGAPYYQWKNLIEKNQVQVFSSNFELYSDMSHRIMLTLEELCPCIEIYSVDEAFLSFDQIDPAKHEDYARHIRQTIKTWTGIPVSVGLAPTKTLAKIANHLAKKYRPDGVFNLCDQALCDKILAQFPIEDIWGIGRKLAPELQKFNIHTAQQLRDANPKILRKRFSVVMERIIQELQGVSCLPLEIMETQKQIQYSRSFGKPITELADIEEALSHFTARACEKLRQLDSVAQGIYVFLHTNLFSKVNPRYSNSCSAVLAQPSSDTRDFIHAAKNCLQRIYKSGYQYHKTGIMLTHLSPQGQRQADFFAPRNNVKNLALMNTMDELHKRWGQKSLFFCAEGIERDWIVKRKLRTPRYTTHWEELLIVKTSQRETGLSRPSTKCEDGPKPE